MKIAHFNTITYFNLSFFGGEGIEEGGVDIFVFLYLFFFITIELILNLQFVQQFL